MSVWLSKELPGSALGYVWEKAGSIVEVAEHDAQELLRIIDAKFRIVEPPEPAPEPVTEAIPEPDPAVPAEPAAPADKPKAPGRGKSAPAAVTESA